MIIKRPNSGKYTELPQNHTCLKCNIEKPFTTEYFPKHNGRLFKIDYVCKDCGSKRKARQLKENRPKANEASKNWIRQNLKKGLCTKCSSIRLPNSNLFCEKHYFQNVSSKILGTKKRWQELKNLLEAQNYKCAYTKIDLVLGKNASVDHMKCIARHPELKFEITNLQWVDLKVNYMKRDLDEPDLINLCKLILQNKNNSGVEQW